MSKKDVKGIVIKIPKVRNPMGAVKMTGAGSHRPSNKSIRQSQKKMMSKMFDNGKEAFDKPLSFFIFPYDCIALHLHH